MKEQTFEALKTEILKRAKNANACADEYKLAYMSNDYNELMQVIKNNFYFAVYEKVIDVSLIESYKEQFSANQIFCNVNASEGFLLAYDNATVNASGNATVNASGNATVYASDNATVYASDNATVNASDNATVYASDNATVNACDNATVYASDNATVNASGNATVNASGNATVNASDNATVEASDNATVYASDNATVNASDNATVNASDNATVEASDNAYIASYYSIECQLNDNAIYRICNSNTIRYASDNIKFEKQ